MTPEHNNLVTRIKDLEAQLEAARVGLRDQFAIAIVGGMLANQDIQYTTREAMMLEVFRLADAAMEVRDGK